MAVTSVIRRLRLMELVAELGKPNFTTVYERSGYWVATGNVNVGLARGNVRRRQGRRPAREGAQHITKRRYGAGGGLGAARFRDQGFSA